MQYFANADDRTIVDAPDIGIGRNPKGLKMILNATGVNIVTGAGFEKDQWIPD
jgi:predicted metal-dependent phosphotriesterase family hydrolase